MPQQKVKDVKNGIYRHYKGKMYRVVCVCKHSETLEDMVVYEALYDDTPLGKFWVRPKLMFLEEVEFEGVRMPHFEFVGDAVEEKHD